MLGDPGDPLQDSAGDRLAAERGQGPGCRLPAGPALRSRTRALAKGCRASFAAALAALAFLGAGRIRDAVGGIGGFRTGPVAVPGGKRVYQGPARVNGAPTLTLGLTPLSCLRFRIHGPPAVPPFRPRWTLPLTRDAADTRSLAGGLSG